jgi:hypothetical protein
MNDVLQRNASKFPRGIVIEWRDVIQEVASVPREQGEGFGGWATILMSELPLYRVLEAAQNREST